MVDLKSEKVTGDPAYWLMLLVGFLLPLVGLILGLKFQGRDLPHEKKIGRHTLVAAGLGFVAFCLLVAAYGSGQGY